MNKLFIVASFLLDVFVLFVANNFNRVIAPDALVVSFAVYYCMMFLVLAHAFWCVFLFFVKESVVSPVVVEEILPVKVVDNPVVFPDYVGDAEAEMSQESVDNPAYYDDYPVEGSV